jgi:hypothetical protein
MAKSRIPCGKSLNKGDKAGIFIFQLLCDSCFRKQVRRMGKPPYIDMFGTGYYQLPNMLIVDANCGQSLIRTEKIK